MVSSTPQARHQRSLRTTAAATEDKDDDDRVTDDYDGDGPEQCDNIPGGLRRMFLGAASCRSHCSPLLTLSLFLAANRGPVQFSSVAQSCPTLCDLMDCSTPGLLVHHQLPELAQTHVNRVGDAIQPSHPLSSPSPPAFNLSQHQSLLQWVSSSQQMAKVLEFQVQHQSCQ